MRPLGCESRESAHLRYHLRYHQTLSAIVHLTFGRAIEVETDGPYPSLTGQSQWVSKRLRPGGEIDCRSVFR